MQNEPPRAPDPRHRRVAQAALRWLTFPAGLGIFALAAAALHQQWLPRPELVHLATFAASAWLASTAERVLPFRAEWARVPDAERRTDRVSLLTLFALVDPLLKFVLMPALASLAAATLVPAGGASVWSTSAPLPAQLGLAVLLAELGSYSLHRLAHRWPVLWGIHAFHHAPPRLYWLNGFRVNPLNIVWHQLSSILLLRLLGAPPDIVQMVVALGIVIAVLQHCNADVRYDGWNLLFGTADLHRWHHALDARESGNYGTLINVWDRVFGTYRRGHAGPEQVGVVGALPADGGYLRELWRTYVLHSTAARAVGALAQASHRAADSNALCSTCPLPRGRTLSLRQRVRSWLPAPLSGCCNGGCC
jgi:sterol desaturase/sphingolipid hydroxylase (fatty acid hydroxylase superfamily)